MHSEVSQSGSGTQHSWRSAVQHARSTTLPAGPQHLTPTYTARGWTWHLCLWVMPHHTDSALGWVLPSALGTVKAWCQRDEHLHTGRGLGMLLSGATNHSTWLGMRCHMERVSGGQGAASCMPAAALLPADWSHTGVPAHHGRIASWAQVIHRTGRNSTSF